MTPGRTKMTKAHLKPLSSIIFRAKAEMATNPTITCYYMEGGREVRWVPNPFARLNHILTTGITEAFKNLEKALSQFALAMGGK